MKAAIIIPKGIHSSADRFNAFDRIGSIDVATRIVLTLTQLDFSEIVVVVDEENEALLKKLKGFNLTFITTKNDEMINYIKTAISYLGNKYNRVLVSTLDIPFIEKETTINLLNAKGDICIPITNEKRGHPVVLSKDVFPHLLAYSGCNGLRGFIRESDFNINFVNTSDIGSIMRSFDEDLVKSKLKEHHINQLRLDIKIRICKEKPFLGNGTVKLLKLIDGSGSIKTACKYMGLSYDKGRQMVANMEKQLGMVVVETRQGGEKGGASFVNEKGKELIEKYELFLKKSEIEISKIFNEYFSSFGSTV